MRIFTLLLVVPVLLSACDGSSPDVDSSASRDGKAASDLGARDHSGMLEGQPADSWRGDGSKRKDASGQDSSQPTGKWTVAATQSDLAWSNGRLAAHPTQPKTIAVKLEVSQFTPNVEVAVSANLGGSISKATVKTYSGTPGMGHYDTFLGFGYDPGNGSQLAVLTLMPMSGPTPSFDSLVFGTSTTGGASFTSSTLSTNPWPPDVMHFVPGLGAGAKSELFVRAQHVLYSSKDLGQTLTTVFDDSKLCLAHGEFTVNPADHTIFLLVCGSTLLRCQGKSCSPATLPAGATVVYVAFSPVDATGVVATGSGKVLVSTDGGKSFSTTTTLGGAALRIAWDPRAGTRNVYLLDLTASKLHRSTNGGSTFTNVTPPTSMKPPYGTYLRDVAVAADGTVVGLAHPGVITLPAP